MKVALVLLLASTAAAAPPVSGPGSNFIQMGKDAFERGNYTMSLDFFFSELKKRPESIEAKAYITRIGEIWREAESEAESTPAERKRALKTVLELLELRKRRLSKLNLDLEEVRRQLEPGSADTNGLLKVSRSLSQFKELEPGDRALAEQSKRYIELLQAQLRKALQRGGTFENPKELMVARGFLWYYRDDLDKALMEWRRALALAPEDPLLAEQIRWVSRKKTLLERKNTMKELLRQADAASREGMNEQALLYWRSLVIMEPDNKQFQKSMILAQEAVQKIKAQQKLKLAYQALRQERLSDASQVFLEVLEVDPMNREALEQLKAIQLKVRRRVEREEQVRPAASVAIGPSTLHVEPERSREKSESQYTLGLIFYAQGESEKAKQALEAALKHDQYNQKAKNALARIQAELP